MLSWFLAVPLAVYLAVLAYLYLFQRQLLYVPDRARPFVAVLPQLAVREVELATSDGLLLLAWYLPPPEGRPVIVYLHGNGGNIGYRADRLMRFARAGCGVLLVEYRGYGGNRGSPSEAGFYSDARAALAFVAEAGIAGNRIVLYGESLGSAVAVAMAAEAAVAALILESPFTSIAAVAQHHYRFIPAALLIWDRFDAAARIGRVRAPILVVQGGRDVVVPARFGEALFAMAPQPKQRWLAPEAGHENLAHYGALNIVLDFIERHVH
ncbi:MAG: alpha/beta hydrolase [Thiohalocapsa sp.]